MIYLDPTPFERPTIWSLIRWAAFLAPGEQSCEIEFRWSPHAIEVNRIDQRGSLVQIDRGRLDLGVTPD